MFEKCFIIELCNEKIQVKLDKGPHSARQRAVTKKIPE
jgi:hypothetical protein